MISKERIQVQALLEVLNGFHASQVLEEIEVAVDVNAGPDESVPMDALELQVSVVLLELEVQGFVEINVWSLNGVHIFLCHDKLVSVKVLWENFHLVRL